MQFCGVGGDEGTQNQTRGGDGGGGGVGREGEFGEGGFDGDEVGFVGLVSHVDGGMSVRVFVLVCVCVDGGGCVSL